MSLQVVVMQRDGEADARRLNIARYATHFAAQLRQVEICRRLGVDELTTKLEHQLPQRQQPSVAVRVVLVKRLQR